MKKLWLLWVSAVIFVLDQWTKKLAMTHLMFAKPVAVLPFLNLQLSFNRGSAFSFLHNAGGWQRWFFIGFSVLICCAIVRWLKRLPEEEKVLRLGLVCIFGGALGNLWDRWILGYVIDFIQFYVGAWSWPIFNIADTAICIGIFFVVLSMFGTSKRSLEPGSK